MRISLCEIKICSNLFWLGFLAFELILCRRIYNAPEWRYYWFRWEWNYGIFFLYYFVIFYFIIFKDKNFESDLIWGYFICWDYFILFILCRALLSMDIILEENRVLQSRLIRILLLLTHLVRSSLSLFWFLLCFVFVSFLNYIAALLNITDTSVRSSLLVFVLVFVLVSISVSISISVFLFLFLSYHIAVYYSGFSTIYFTRLFSEGHNPIIDYSASIIASYGSSGEIRK